MLNRIMRIRFSEVVEFPSTFHTFHFNFFPRFRTFTSSVKSVKLKLHYRLWSELEKCVKLEVREGEVSPIVFPIPLFGFG